MFRWLRDLLASRSDKPPPRVEVVADGFTVVSADGKRAELKWASVTQVVTYKYDMFGYDEIVVAFEVLERPGLLQEVSEHWEGFRSVSDALESEFGIEPEWFGTVMQPPFATNYRVLFERPTEPREDPTGRLG